MIDDLVTYTTAESSVNEFVEWYLRKFRGSTI